MLPHVMLPDLNHPHVNHVNPHVINQMLPYVAYNASYACIQFIKGNRFLVFFFNPK